MHEESRDKKSRDRECKDREGKDLENKERENKDREDKDQESNQRESKDIESEEKENKNEDLHEKENKDRSSPKMFFIFIGLILIFYSLYQLYDVYAPYLDGEGQYSELQALVKETGSPDEGVPGYETNQNPNQDQNQKTDKKSGSGAGSRKKHTGNTGGSIDFKTLKERNPDVMAWITFEKPSTIDYPVVQGKDNQEYLTRTFDGTGNKYGTIFIDADNRPDFSDRNTFLYGHHMANGSMFAGLLDYLDPSYYQEHPRFTIYTADKRVLTYQVCAVELTTEERLSYQWKYETEEEWKEYCDFIQNNAQYNTGVELDENAKLVSLSTCYNTDTNYRVLLHGVLINDQP